MAHAQRTVVIHRPVASVFEFVLNGANNKLWRSSVMDIQPLGKAPYGVGSRFEQGLKGPTGRTPADYEITEMQPNELIGFQVIAGPAGPRGLYRFKDQNGKTEVTFELDSETGSIARPPAAELTQPQLEAAAKDEAATGQLSDLEKKVLGQMVKGKSAAEIARSTSLGEGTIRNTMASLFTKLMEATMQRSLEQEVGMLDELKAFLEKHA